MKKTIFWILTFISAVAKGDTSKQEIDVKRLFPSDCGRQILGSETRRRHARIINGQDAEFGQYPWNVAILKNSKYNCAGVLINNQWVLTAAHCVETTYAVYEFLIGDLDRTLGFEPLKSIKMGKRKIIIHRQFKKHVLDGALEGFDIALIQLKKPVKFQDHIQPICLPPQVNFTEKFDRGVIAGWGKMLYDGKMSPTLQEMLVPIVNNKMCKRMLSRRYGRARYDSTVMCAGFGSGKMTTCHGDSGGPMKVKRVDGRWYTIGIVSWSMPKCGTPQSPIVLTRVDKYIPWIRQTIMKTRREDRENYY